MRDLNTLKEKYQDLHCHRAKVERHLAGKHRRLFLELLDLRLAELERLIKTMENSWKKAYDN